MDRLILGNAPPWAAFFLWLVLAVVFVRLWRGIRREAERERRQRNRRHRDHERRLRAIEDHLLISPPPPEDDRWNPGADE